MTNWTEEQLEAALRNNAWLRERLQDKRSMPQPCMDMGIGKIGQPAKTQEVKLPPEPNQTEARFRDEILIARYGLHTKQIIYQPGQFLLPSGTNWYSPDWGADIEGLFWLWETKGGYKHSRDSEFRFKWARATYGSLNFKIPGWPCCGFHFEAWQWKNKQWKEIWK